MTSTFTYFERAVERLNPEPGQRRARAEQDAAFAGCLARLDVNLERSWGACGAVRSDAFRVGRG